MVTHTSHSSEKGRGLYDGMIRGPYRWLHPDLKEGQGPLFIAVSEGPLSVRVKEGGFISGRGILDDQGVLRKSQGNTTPTRLWEKGRVLPKFPGGGDVQKYQGIGGGVHDK